MVEEAHLHHHLLHGGGGEEVLVGLHELLQHPGHLAPVGEGGGGDDLRAQALQRHVPGGGG